MKTRLVPRLGESRAASLYTAFLEDTVTLASEAAPRQLILFVAGGRAESALSAERLDGLRHQWGDRLREHAQADGDLGQRLAAAFGHAGETETLPLLVLGSDSPDLPGEHLRRALAALAEGVDVVLGPARDGGVWCIGLRRAFPGFFEGLPWSSPHTGDALRNRARELGLKTLDVDPWYDCDDPEDLEELRRRLAQSRGGASATRAWLEHRFPSTPPETP